MFLLISLPLFLSHLPLSQELLNRIEDFQAHSEKVLSDTVSADSASEIQALLDESSEFDVHLPEVPRLRERLEIARWLAAVHQAEESGSSTRGLTLDAMRQLIDRAVGLTSDPAIERAMARLQELLTVSEQWEEKVQGLLKARWGQH